MIGIPEESRANLNVSSLRRVVCGSRKLVVLGAAALMMAVGAPSVALAQNCVSSGFPTNTPGVPDLSKFFPNLASGGGAAAGALTSVLGTMNTAFLTNTNAFVSAPAAPPDSSNGGAWIRGVGGFADTKSTSTLSGNFFAPASPLSALTNISGTTVCDIQTHQEYSGFQVGQDLAKLNVGGWNAHGGVTAGYVESTVRSDSTGFSGNFQTPFVGLYAAATNGGFYVDGLLRMDFYQNHVSFANGGLINQAFNARAVSISGSSGYNMPVGTWFIEPSVGVIFSRLSADSISSAGDKFTDCGIPPAFLLVPCTNSTSGVDTPGTTSFSTIESLLGRVGIRVGTTFTAGHLSLQPFGAVSVWHEFAGDAAASFVSCNGCAFRGDTFPPIHVPVTESGTLSSSRVGTYGQYAIGISGSLIGTGWLGYARVDLKEGSQIEGVNVNAGLRYQFDPKTVAATVGKAPILKAKAPPLVRPAVYDWAGFYAGGFIGALGGFSDWSSLDNGAGIGERFGGLLGGAQAGFNYQMGSWVYGVEGDLGWTNARGATTNPNASDGTALSNPPASFPFGLPPSPFAFGTTPECTTRIDLSCQVLLDAMATFTGRIGYAYDRALFYLRGGGAWMAGTSETFDNYRTIGSPALGVGPICHCILGSARDARLGWAVGAGFEYGYTVNWSIKAEYLYTDFGSRQLTFSDGERWNIKDAFSEVKLGINYHFAASSVLPVSARY
jgi:opacity protein-like surface antigen